MPALDPHLLATHGDFVRGVVRGVLRDEHLVEDAVQDTWLTALRHAPARPRSWRAWLGRVGRNAAVTLVRGEARRRAREAAVARPEAIDAPERLERARAVVEAVVALPEPYRTAVVERYLEGLSAEAVALRHGVTAATVRNRLRHALQLLRESLDARCGLALLVPLAAPAAKTPAAVAAFTGGILMQGKLVVVGMLAAGVAIGWLIPWGKTERTDTPRTAGARGPTTVAGLEAENARLRAHSAALEEQVARLEKQVAATGEPESMEAPKAGAVPIPVNRAAAGIDWEQLQATIGAARATLLRMAEAERQGLDRRTLSPEDQAVAQRLLLEWNTAAAQARTLSTHPMLDARFLPHIVGTMLGGLLDLSDAQRARVEQEMEALAEDLPDTGKMTPLEAYAVRRKVLADAGARIDAVLDARQREQWAVVAPIWEDVQEGNLRTVRVGLRNTSNAAYLVSREMTRYYQLTEAQQNKAAGVSERYLAEGREILRREGQLGDNPVPLDDAGRARLEAAFRDLQGRVEQELFPLLDAAQRERLRLQPPLLLSFEDTVNFAVSTADDRGF